MNTLNVDMESSAARPLIAITAIPRLVQTGYGEDRADTVAQSVTGAVARAGGVPIVLPVVDPALAARQVATIDGLVLSGGQDLDATLRGEQPHPRSTWVDPDRDRHELALLTATLERDLPILGVCRGMQLVVASRGGELAAHIDDHDAGVRDADAGHSVTVAAGSQLAEAVGPDPELQVNTIHHQAVGRLPDGLRVSATAADGTVEAIEGTIGRSWFLGVQWHPELMLDERGGQPVFDALVAQIRRRWRCK